MEIFRSDEEIRAHAMTMWANRIETGDGNLSLRDCADMGREVCPISSFQAAFVARLRKLAAAESGR